MDLRGRVLRDERKAIEVAPLSSMRLAASKMPTCLPVPILPAPWRCSI